MPDSATDAHPTGLAALIANLCPREGSHGTAIPGLYLTRSSTTDVPRQALDQAVFCVVAQGSKSIQFSGQRFLYDPSRFLLVSLDLPLVGQIEEASRAKPFLGFSLVLDFDEIASLILTSHPATDPAARQTRSNDGAIRPGLIVGSLDHDLLGAVTRLAGLLRQPAHIPVLAPLIRREIYYRLLLTQHSGLLQRMAAENGKATRVAAGLDWLRRNATRTIRMEELARELNMSPSSMHSWFRTVTSMSPLQFQKQLRLQEARRLMLTESMDANTAGRRVGYESASQFSREYGRFFGAPPMRDIEGLRLSATENTVTL